MTPRGNCLNPPGFGGKEQDTAGYIEDAHTFMKRNEA